MTVETNLSVADRLVTLFDHLGISRAHLVGWGAEIGTLAAAQPDRVASATLVCPMQVLAGPLRPVADRLLFIHGDQGPSASRVPDVLPSLSDAKEVVLQEYFDAAWSDPAADRTDAVLAALQRFLTAADARDTLPALDGPDEQGNVAGISYRSQGAGPPLMFLPIALAASQWEPLIPLLSQQYRVISLGGAYMGAVAVLEDRARGGYGLALRAFVDDINPLAGERILEVGCGSGAVTRTLARRTGAGGIVAVDVNRYFLREAADLAAAEGLAGRIAFQEGSALDLPFPAESFDVTVSCTVMEEVDADRMLAEMIRVTRPGGRIGVMVRATDLRGWNSLPLPPDLWAKTDVIGGAAGAGVAEGGCADASLYRRFREAGLADLVVGPKLGMSQPGIITPTMLRQFEAGQRSLLNAEEARVWQAIYDLAVAEGTLFMANPVHCAVGTKP